MVIEKSQIHRQNIYRSALIDGYSWVNKKTYETIDVPSLENKIFPGYCKWLSNMKLTQYSNKWNCINYSEAFKVFSDIYHVSDTKSKADSIAIGIIKYFSESRVEDNTQGLHCINVGLISQDDEIKPIFIEPQTCSIIDLKQKEIKTIYMFNI
jgi:hypothetical protein